MSVTWVTLRRLRREVAEPARETGGNWLACGSCLRRKSLYARIQLAGQADEPLAGALLTSLEALAPTPFDLVSKLAHLLLRNSAALISREGSFCGVDCR